MRRIARNLVPRVLTWTGIRPAFHAVLGRLRMPYLVAINYHWTAEESETALDRQLDYLESTFTVLDRAGLDAFFAGRSKLERPGLLLTFDDGNRNTYDVAARLLEKRAMKAWFFVIAATLDPATPGPIEGINRRFCMGAAELRDLRARGHEIGCHTYTHVKLGPLSGEQLDVELVRSKSVLEAAIGAPVDSFCYPYGTIDGYSEAAHRVASARYTYIFNSCPTIVRPSSSKHAIGRHDVAPDMDEHLFRLKTSGLLNYKYRERVRHYRDVCREAS